LLLRMHGQVRRPEPGNLEVRSEQHVVRIELQHVPVRRQLEPPIPQRCEGVRVVLDARLVEPRSPVHVVDPQEHPRAGEARDRHRLGEQAAVIAERLAVAGVGVGQLHPASHTRRLILTIAPGHHCRARRVVDFEDHLVAPAVRGDQVLRDQCAARVERHPGAAACIAHGHRAVAVEHGHVDLEERRCPRPIRHHAGESAGRAGEDIDEEVRIHQPQRAQRPVQEIAARVPRGLMVSRTLPFACVNRQSRSSVPTRAVPVG
jgi:hypothetical protein